MSLKAIHLTIAALVLLGASFGCGGEKRDDGAKVLAAYRDIRPGERIRLHLKASAYDDPAERHTATIIMEAVFVSIEDDRLRVLSRGSPENSTPITFSGSVIYRIERLSEDEPPTPHGFSRLNP